MTQDEINKRLANAIVILAGGVIRLTGTDEYKRIIGMVSKILELEQTLIDEEIDQ